MLFIWALDPTPPHRCSDTTPPSAYTVSFPCFPRSSAVDKLAIKRSISKQNTAFQQPSNIFWRPLSFPKELSVLSVSASFPSIFSRTFLHQVTSLTLHWEWSCVPLTWPIYSDSQTVPPLPTASWLVLWNYSHWLFIPFLLAELCLLGQFLKGGLPEGSVTWPLLFYPQTPFKWSL